MTKHPRNAALFAILTFVAVTAFGQDRGQWRTATDIREGGRGSVTGTVSDIDATRNRLTLQMDEDRYGNVRVEADAVSTRYNGFGGVINGNPEIFIGSNGFSNVREGDRIEVRGTGKGTGIVVADTVTLLGRSVAAGPVGVGQSRSPNEISTPTPRATTPPATTTRRGIQGIVQNVNARENRLVIQTQNQRLITVRGNAQTPVFYRNETFRIGNIEVGDVVLIEQDTIDAAADDVRARSIEVIESVQDRQGTTTRVQNLSGRVTRVDANASRIWISAGRDEVAVDLDRAYDAGNREARSGDYRVGDQVTVTGSYQGGTFVATTIRFNEDVFAQPPASTVTVDADREYVIVNLTATVVESLDTASELVVRDRTSNRTITLHVTEDFVVRTKAGSYVTADKLKVNDAILVKAFRDDNGNHVAQTIRYR